MKLNAKTLMIVGIVLVAMVLEAAVLFFIMPSKGQQATAGPQEEAKKKVEDEVPSDDSVEVPIDSFNCTNNRIAPGSVVHVSFKVACVVAAGQNNPFNEAANTKHKTRVRQAIERIARSSTLEELNDPNLFTIKRLIREETNKIVGKSFVTEVVITDFRLMEQ